jgi:transaldolase/glucose-6-phosphate isomerase
MTLCVIIRQSISMDDPTTPADDDLTRVELALPDSLRHRLGIAAAAWDASRATGRLWGRDPGLWTGGDEGAWLDWLDVAERQRRALSALASITALAAGRDHVLLIGMGGSSLGPEVLGSIFGKRQLHVIDSTDPDQIRAVEAAIDLDRTLIIVASKSGSTLEPALLLNHFLDLVRGRLGAAAGEHFVAITDPGSKLQAIAEAQEFAAIHLGEPRIGGRFSVLSAFGMVPAAAIGIDVGAVLDRAIAMAAACRPGPFALANPGVLLGLALGQAAKAGRDKLTLITDGALAGFGAWVEQLVAESTGKEGKAIIPVDGEALGAPEIYGTDRIFVAMTVAGEAPAPGLDALQAAGHPVIRIILPDSQALGQAFYLWEFATAVAGHVLGIHPFDQPDVEASKIATRRLTEEIAETGSLPTETPFATSGPFRLFADPANRAALDGNGLSLDDILRRHFARLHAGDYAGLLAYLPRGSKTIAPLQRMRLAIRAAKRVATCVGFGPRFLHSTGQAYKGGPNSGVFLQITADPAVDLPVPGQTLTFGQVEAAQARGDLEVLAERGRRHLRIHIGGDLADGLDLLAQAVERAVAAPGVNS